MRSTAAGLLVWLVAWCVPGLAAERAIVKEVVVAASPQQAWDAWTTREGIVGFFAPDARIEPRSPGARGDRAVSAARMAHSGGGVRSGFRPRWMVRS